MINMLVGRKKIEWIAYNIRCSDHSLVRMLQRDENDDKTLRDRILNSPLAWKTYNNRICIALNLYEYIVVNPNAVDGDDDKKYPLLLTFSNTKIFDVTVLDKMFLSYKEFNIKGVI